MQAEVIQLIPFLKGKSTRARSKPDWLGLNIKPGDDLHQNSKVTHEPQESKGGQAYQALHLNVDEVLLGNIIRELRILKEQM